METTIQTIKKSQLKEVPVLKAGDTVRLHQKVKEGGKERIQIFEGIVIAHKHGGISGTITVRKVIDGIGVERIFPLHTPSLAKIELVRSGKVRRAKLYFMRHAKGKKAKLKGNMAVVAENPPASEPQQESSEVKEEAAAEAPQTEKGQE